MSRSFRSGLFGNVFQPGNWSKGTRPYVACILAIAALAVVFKITGPFYQLRNLVEITIAVAAFIALVRNSEPHYLARLILYFVAGFCVYSLLRRMPGILSLDPAEWDFLCFYLHAKVASAGMNLYEASSFIRIADDLRLSVSNEFEQEILRVGFLYPPPTVLLFYPLSFMDMETANRVWLSSIIVCHGAACLMLSSIVFKRIRYAPILVTALDAVALATVLVLANPATLQTIYMGQTTPLLFCFLILAMRSPATATGGIAACIAVLVKPVAAIPGLILVIGQYWRSIAIGVLTGVFLLIVSLAVVGTDDLTSYVRQDYVASSPPWLYTELHNQSLLAFLSRKFGVAGYPWDDWRVMVVFGWLSVFVVLLSVWLVKQIIREHLPTAYSVLLTVALLVYPGTQATYGLLLAIPLAVELWNQVEAREPDIRISIFVCIATALGIFGLFYATVFMWLMLIRRSLIIAGFPGLIGSRNRVESQGM